MPGNVRQAALVHSARKELPRRKAGRADRTFLTMLLAAIFSAACRRAGLRFIPSNFFDWQTRVANCSKAPSGPTPKKISLESFSAGLL